MKNLSIASLDTAVLLEDLFKDAHDFIQFVRLDGTLIMVNKAWAVFLGYNNDEIEGKSLYSFIEEKDHARYRSYRNQIITGELVGIPIIFDLKKRDGSTITVEGVVSVKRVNGEPLYTRGIFRDITFRLQTEAKMELLNQELKERQENIQHLLQNAPDAVIVIDQESSIQFWNPKAEALFGWKSEAVLHQSLANTIIPLRYHEAHYRGMKRFLSTGETRVLNRTIEITALKRSGEEFYVALTISPTQQDGKTAFIAFIRDISEQKNNQQELENKTKKLELSNAYLADFAHLASHDLKEPLRKILVFADRLKQSLKAHLTDTDTSLFLRLASSAERMQLLVDDLLEFSHMSDRESELEEVDLNDKLQKVLENLELVIEEKGAKVVISNMPIVKGNRRQLLQLFHNLIGNALKYSKPQVAPVVEITSRVTSGAEAFEDIAADQRETFFHFIEVRDNGIGFEQEYAKQIFQIFRRLHGKTEYGGSGVGLAIASQVVANHQGYIWATSKPGEGATFHILLPVHS